MNLLKKQGFFNSIILYMGTALGFFNLIILFQRVLTAEQIGFFALISASVSLLYAQVAALGYSSAITRFFPFFKSEDRKHNGFPTYVFRTTLISFLIITLIYVLGKEYIVKFKSATEVTSYFLQYYYLIIPVALFGLWYNLSETFARTSFHNILPSFLREVGLKALTSISVILVYWGWIDYQGFVYWYVCANGLILLLLLFYLKKLDLLRFKAIQPVVKEKSPEIFKYGLYSMLAGGSFAMIQNIDTILLKVYTDEKTVGLYFTMFAIATVISLPAKALNTTSYQIIADAWKTNDLQKINKIYHKTSLVQFIIGCLLLIGLIANWHNILILLKKPEYVNFYSVFIVVAIGFLFDITGGLNGAIISFSKHYKLVMYILISAALLCALLNIYFIPQYLMLGAAIAYTITMFLLNFTYWAYLKFKHRLQPFNVNFVKVLSIGALSLLVGLYVPIIDNFLIDVFIRSFVMSFIYIGLIFAFKISPDINEAILQLIKKFKR